MDTVALMDAAYEKGASDLHISVGRRPVLRVGGGLVELGDAPLTPEDTERLARALAPDRNWEELEESGSTDFGLAHADKCRFRVSILTQKGTRGIVMRQIPQKLLTFDQIGLPESVRDLLHLHRGLVLVTGPTGSGKTTTLATMIDWINRNRDVHIITIEDPVEYYHTHQQSMVTQREVGTDVTTFSEAMRRALRQDPDVILLGEMRDLETTSAAITAAETGHLVFGTLHTTGASRTVDRIIDQYPKEQQEQIRAQLAQSLVAVISQILVPTPDGGRAAAVEGPTARRPRRRGCRRYLSRRALPPASGRGRPGAWRRMCSRRMSWCCMSAAPGPPGSWCARDLTAPRPGSTGATTVSMSTCCA